MDSKILIITVNYGSPDMTLQLLKSLPSDNNLCIWVEDNQSSENSKRILSNAQGKTDQNISLYFHNNNWFYWGAFYQAYQRLISSENPFPKWIVICNNDIIFDGNFLNELEKIDSQSCHILAPAIVSHTTKKNLNPFFQTPLSFIDKAYYRLLYFHPMFGRVIQMFGKKLNQGIKKISPLLKYPNTIYAPHGACIIFSPEFFKKGGYIDTGFKMFGEELSTAEIAKKIGAKIYYQPQLKVTHNDHFSTNNLSWDQLYSISKETYFYLKNRYQF